MKKIVLITLTCGIFVSFLFAHSWRTNSDWCHNNRKTWGYHCHNWWNSYSNLSSYNNTNTIDQTTKQPVIIDMNAICNNKYPWTIYRSSDDMCVCPNGKLQDSRTKSCDIKKIEQPKIYKPKINMTYYETDKDYHCNLNWPWTVYRASDDMCICENWMMHHPRTQCVKPKTDNISLKNKLNMKNWKWEENMQKCDLWNWEFLREWESMVFFRKSYAKSRRLCFWSHRSCIDGELDGDDEFKYPSCLYEQ